MNVTKCWFIFLRSKIFAYIIYNDNKTKIIWPNTVFIKESGIRFRDVTLQFSVSPLSFSLSLSLYLSLIVSLYIHSNPTFFFLHNKRTIVLCLVTLCRIFIFSDQYAKYFPPAQNNDERKGLEPGSGKAQNRWTQMPLLNVYTRKIWAWRPIDFWRWWRKEKVRVMQVIRLSATWRRVSLFFSLNVVRHYIIWQYAVTAPLASTNTWKAISYFIY